MSLYLGIDIGTTHIKAGLSNEAGQLIAIASTHNGPDTECGAGHCYDVDGLWERVARVVREVCKGREADVNGVGVTGMADSGLPLDEQGQALYHIIPWSNPCGAEYREEISARFPVEDLALRTGQRYHPKFAASRLLWLREHEPEQWQRMAVWLSITDFICFRLTGERATDETFACRTMLYDMEKHVWSSELADWFGVSGRLPRVVQPGGVVGKVCPLAARELGLRAGIPVVSAGHDHLCALSIVEAASPGGVLNSLGTAEVFVGTELDRVLASGEISSACYAAGVNRGCFGAGKSYWMANLPASGASLEWLRSIASTGGEITYADWDAAAPGASGSGGVVYLPYLNGSGTPTPDSTRRGAFLGLSSQTSLSELICAVNEGLAFETRRILECLEKTLGKPIPFVTAVGGGVRNRGLLRAKADIAGKEYRICPQAELTLLGAARHAAKAAGAVLPPVVLDNAERVLPNPFRKAVFEEKYKEYRRYNDLLKP